MYSECSSCATEHCGVTSDDLSCALPAQMHATHSDQTISRHAMASIHKAVFCGMVLYADQCLAKYTPMAHDAIGRDTKVFTEAVQLTCRGQVTTSLSALTKICLDLHPWAGCLQGPCLQHPTHSPPRHPFCRQPSCRLPAPSLGQRRLPSQQLFQPHGSGSP